MTPLGRRTDFTNGRYELPASGRGVIVGPSSLPPRLRTAPETSPRPVALAILALATAALPFIARDTIRRG